MGQAGILGEDERPELLAGAIVKMAPIGSRRQATVDRFNRLFSIRVVDRAIVSIHGPVRLAEHSEPQPDLMLLRRRADFYASAHPGPDDVLQLVEVSDTSTQYDREVKLPLYSTRNGKATVAKMQEFAKEAGRDPSSIGIEPRINFVDGDPEYWQSVATAWRRLDATHISVNTMRAGLATPQAHIDAIQQFREVFKE